MSKIPKYNNPMPPPPETEEGKAWAKYALGLLKRQEEILGLQNGIETRKIIFGILGFFIVLILLLIK